MFEDVTQYDLLAERLQAERQTRAIAFLEARRNDPAVEVMGKLHDEFKPSAEEARNWLRAWMQRP
jgi:hypothetical protein